LEQALSEYNKSDIASTAMKLSTFFKGKIAISVVSLIVVNVFTFGFFLTRPYHDPHNVTGVFSVYLGHTSPDLLQRIIGNIPEIYQVRVITLLAPLYHNKFSRKEASQFWSTSAPIYQKMQKEQNWKILPSALSSSYMTLLHLNSRQNQYYIYASAPCRAKTLSHIVLTWFRRQLHLISIQAFLCS
jgi:hypothetical protein